MFKSVLLAGAVGLSSVFGIVGEADAQVVTGPVVSYGPPVYQPMLPPVVYGQPFYQPQYVYPGPAFGGPLYRGPAFGRTFQGPAFGGPLYRGPAFGRTFQGPAFGGPMFRGPAFYRW
jgi:hypothetical protein